MAGSRGWGRHAATRFHQSDWGYVGVAACRAQQPAMPVSETMRRRDNHCRSCACRRLQVRALIEGETDVQVLWFRVRGLHTRHWSIDQRSGRHPRLAKVSHVGDGFAGWVVLRLWRNTRADSDGEARYCGQPLADPRPRPQRKARRIRRGAAWPNHYGCRPTGLERHRRLGSRSTLSPNAGAISDV